VWVGPFECGSIFNAVRDWKHLVRDSANRVKNIWNCKCCYGDWMGSHRTGQWAVMLYDWDRVLSLVLDHPDDKLLAAWLRERALLYKKVEPKASLRDERPVYPKSSKLSTLQFAGEASERVWKILLSDLDENMWKELEGNAASTLPPESELEMLTKLSTGAQYHTLNSTQEGRDAVKACLKETPEGKRLGKERVTLEAATKSWLAPYQAKPGEKTLPATPATEVVQSVVAEKDPTAASSSSSAAALEAPAPMEEGPADGSQAEPHSNFASTQAANLANEISQLRAAIAQKKQSEQ